MAQLTRTLALELGDRRIRVNALALDAIPTAGDRGLRSNMLTTSAYDAADIPPLRYHGSPDDAAAAALFLVSDLSRFITGTTVHVDGGNWAAGVGTSWRRRSNCAWPRRSASTSARHGTWIGASSSQVLLVLVSAWAAVLLIGLKRDLPSPETDEPYFVLPAVEMAAHGDANPHWFGHPASTVINPLAIVYRVRETVFHGGPVFGASPGVADRFQDDADSFYILGRLWVILLTLATVPVAFFVGRRFLGNGGALIAVGCWMLVPIVVQYGRIVRSDSAGTLFGLVALLACLRALDKPTAARFMVGGAAIGLAVSSRYFMAVLIPVLMISWWSARRRDTTVLMRSLVLGLGASVAAFVATTPYFLFDWRQAELSLRAETVGKIGNQHFGMIDNLGFYLGTALPHVLSWPVLVLAGVGIAIAQLRGALRSTCC